MTLTHASFFSGVGGLDMGLERAGWSTVSFSEIDPYASAVLARHWPGVPNLGDISQITEVPEAVLWSGGFPCQDLSMAGRRAGLAGSRSGLALTFLDLVGQHRPVAILLENVVGLLSSNAGRDLGTLLGRLGDLGYGWAYRVLDAQWFGVPQRRKRVFIVAVRRGGCPDPDGAGEVLAVGTSCGRDHAAEREAWARTPAGASDSPLWTDRFVGPVDGALGHHGMATPQQSVNMGHIRVVGPVRAGGNRATRQELDDIPSLVIDGAPAYPSGVRAADGLARRVDDRAGVAFVKVKRASSSDDHETWRAGEVAPTLNSFDVGDTRAVTLVAPTLQSNRTGGYRFDADQAEASAIGPTGSDDDPLLPVGLDSHRYRCCGNGVVAPVAEFVGERLRVVVERLLAERAA